MQIGLLGQVQVLDERGARLQLGGPKQRGVLAMLALQPRVPLSADALIDGIWGERLPPRPQRTLSVYVSTLRHLLSESADAPTHLSPTITASHGYSLEVSDLDVDAGQFRKHLTIGRKALADARPAFALDELGAGLRLFRGTPVEDLADLPFARAARDTLLAEEFDARQLRVQAALELGRHRELLPEIEALAGEHALNEGVWAQLMLALYRDGRQSDALIAYRRAVKALREEAGVDPGPELSTMHHKILAHDASLRVRAPRTRGAQVPRPLTPIVARAAVLRHLDEILAAAPGQLLTLVGPGGIGKTRLALELANHALPAIDTHVWFVDCTTVVNGEGLTAAVSAALGVEPGNLFEPRLPGDEQHGLLVADNLEQVAEDAAGILAALVAADPNLSVVATSRVRLGCTGERVIEVPPLPVSMSGDQGPPVPPAVQMYLSLAEQTFPDLRIHDDDLDDVAELCQALGGLPLAIELAAAQARTLTPRQTTERVITMLGSPRQGGDTPLTARLRATIETSRDGLSEAARDGFSLLSVFAGGFTLDACESICGRATDLAPAVWLIELVDASLVQPTESEAGRRFTVLEPLRLVAQGRCHTHADAQHAAYFAALGVEAARLLLLADRDQARVQATFRTEHANWDKALAWAVDNDPALGLALVQGWLPWWSATPIAFEVALRALHRLGERGDQRSELDAARSDLLRGIAEYLAGNLGTGQSLLRSGTTRLRQQAPDDPLLVRGLCFLGACAHGIGHKDEARRAAADAREAAQRSGNTTLITWALDLSSFVAIGSGDLAQAEGWVLDALRLDEQVEDPNARCFDLRTLADVYFEQERPQDVRRCAQDIMAAYRTGTVSDVLQLMAARALARAAMLEGNPVQAAEPLVEAIQGWQKAGMYLDVLTDAYLAVTILALVNTADAVNLLDVVDAAATAIGADRDAESQPVIRRIMALDRHPGGQQGPGARLVAPRQLAAEVLVALGRIAPRGDTTQRTGVEQPGADGLNPF